VPFVPGIATPTELMHVISKGFHVVKFFPAVPFGGSGTLRAMAV
jgi:2-dehydro-3-deoxyphosphogluconate aldolase/(4S)-4-hydroxy-2-oxoglutarate aldolase